MTRVDVEVLGQPSLAVDGITLPLSGRQLAVALRLALARQRPVSAARLLTAWPGDTGTDGALRVTLTRLRPMLAPAQITRLDSGYLITPAPDIDADRFEHHLRVARDPAESLTTRLQQVQAALALWKGPALDGFDELDWARHEAARLDELREQARDLRYQLVLDAAPGEGPSPDDIIPELAGDLGRTPGREHRASLLATALYRAGRQGDALTTLSGVRRYLRDELGLAPGRALDELELQILNHDPRLAAPAVAVPPHPEIDRQLTSARALLRQDAGLAAETIADSAVGAARSHGHRGQLAESLIVLAHAAMATGSRPVDPLIDEAQAHARVLGSGELLGRAALARFGRGVPSDWQAGLVELTEPLDSLAPGNPLRVELIAAAATVLAFNGETAATEQLLHAAEDTHRAVATARSEAVWLATRAILSDHRRAMADAMRSVEVAKAAGDPRLVVVAVHAVLRVGFATGELALAEEHLDLLDDASRRSGIAFGRVRVPIARGALALARGDLEDAAAAIHRTLEVGVAVQGHAADPAANVQRVLLAIERGEAAAIAPFVRDAATTRRVPGWIALTAVLGSPSDLAVLHDTLPEIVPNDHYAMAVSMVAWAALAHRDRELAEWSLPRLKRLGTKHPTIGFGTIVFPPATMFAGHAHAVLGDWAAACGAYATTESIAARVESPLWVAEARLRRAGVLVEQGDPEATDALLDATVVDPAWGRLTQLRDAVRSTRLAHS